MLTSLEGTELILGDNESQSIQISVGNSHVTILRVTGIFTNQTGKPLVQSKDINENVIETQEMDVLSDIHQILIFNPHRGLYYLTFTNPDSGMATFQANLVFQDGTEITIGFQNINILPPVLMGSFLITKGFGSPKLITKGYGL